MMLGLTAPPQLILGAFLVACLLPEGSSLAVVREETVINSTMSKSEVKALLRVARAELQAKMNKSGVAARWPFDPKPWNLLSGTYWNCLQTVLTATEPIWSMMEGILATAASCKGSDEECAEASLSLSETSLGVVGYLLDFPTDCLGYSCAIKAENEDERVHPTVYTWTMRSGAVDLAGAILGVGAAGLGTHLQCKEKLGDSLGLPDPKASPWLHPSLVSFVPVAKEIREISQITKSNGESTRYQQLEKWAALAERLSGAVQSVWEVLMHEESNKGTPDTAASAKEGCIAAGAHIASSALALFGSILKSVACYRGELELPADINDFEYKAAAMQVGKKDANTNPKPSPNEKSKTVQISGGGMDVEISGAGVAPCVPDTKRSLDDYCQPFMSYYDGDTQIKNSKGRMLKTGEACRQKCCDENSYPDVMIAQVQTILNSAYCTELK